MQQRIGILGFGGLGQAAAKLLSQKQEMRWVAVADRQGYAHSPAGLDWEACSRATRASGSVGELGTRSNASIRNLIDTADVDGYFLALPNLPNTFGSR